MRKNQMSNQFSEVEEVKIEWKGVIENSKAQEEVKQKRKKRNITIASMIGAVVVAIIIAIAVPSVVKNNDIIARAGLLYKHNVNETGYVVSGVEDENITECIIPESYRGKPITRIDEFAFDSCKRLTNVIIPDSVTSIGSWAFNDCIALTSVTVGNGVTSIGEYAFGKCDSQTSITIPFVGPTKDGTSDAYLGYIFGEYDSGANSHYVPSSLKEVIITGGTKIGYSAFKGCTGLTNVIISDSVTSIESSAFEGCTGLTSITISDSVTSIESYALRGCIGLTSITIPNSVTSIEYGVFEDCTGLTSVTIGNSVTSIGSWAFMGCTGLTSVTIGSNVTSIGKFAFAGCTGLTGITIPDSVTSIGNDAFFLCDSLKSISFADTNGWYKTERYNDWNDKIGGTPTDVANSSSNAKYFTDTFYNYYWYKV